HVGGALAVGAQDVPLVRHQGGVVQVAAAQLVEADDERGVEAGGAVEQLQGLARAEGEGVLAGQLLGVGVAGEEALGETDDLDAVALGLLQPLDHLGQVPLEVPALALELPVSDAHVPPPSQVNGSLATAASSSAGTSAGASCGEAGRSRPARYRLVRPISTE